MTEPTAVTFFSEPLYVAAILTAPVVMLASAFVPTRVALARGRHYADLIQRFSFVAFAGAFLATAQLVVSGPITFRLAPFLPAGYFDALSAMMLLLVSFLGVIVTRYSCRYLDGNPEQGRFAKWLSITLGTVLALIVSGHLLIFTIAWISTSVSLHQLLTFFRDRPSAILAAKKKFVISRLGDACLIGALATTWYCFGTWEFSALFQVIDGLRSHGAVLPPCLGWASLFLVGGALLKSAQFPFHSWLPDTMETPTPVSALMHAGLINAGGFLVIRLSPVIASAPGALNALALVGAITALYGSIVMLTQTSVKRSLAYSTIAQMGFMMLQCGLGAFALAALHLVAHALYKAYAFLSSGSIVSLTRAAWRPTERVSAHPAVLVATLGSAVALTWGIGSLFGLSLANEPEVLLLSAIFLMGVSFLLWNLWSASQEVALIGLGLLLIIATSTAYFTLHAGFEELLSGSLTHYAPVRTGLEYGVMAFIALLFLAVLVMQAQIPAWSQSAPGQKIYLYASNGFYIGTWANRLMQKKRRGHSRAPSIT